MPVPLLHKMSVSLGHTNSLASNSSPLQKELLELYGFLNSTKTAPEPLVKLLASLRPEMETPPQAAGAGVRTFGGTTSSQGNWRSGVGRSGGAGHGGRDGGREGGRDGDRRFQRVSSRDSFHTGNSPRTPTTPQTPSSSGSGLSRPMVGRYQSRFNKSETNLNEKILNTVIGNKLNAFTQLTYNDTRDFIYQILDSGETDFIRDFVEKVFKKATSEELFCALFAKLIAEIASRYPVIYAEMNKKHKEFLKIFESVIEGATDSQTEQVIEARQYRMGYGLFLSELAGQNALEKSQLFALVGLIVENVWNLTAEENRIKTVEEFIDCLVVLLRNLKERSVSYFGSVRQELSESVLEKAATLIDRKGGDRPSLSNKARFALMDLRDLLR
jgi:hypothetical protein